MMGYDISSSQKEGYRLAHTSANCSPTRFTKNFRTKFIGKKIRYLENTPSTIWIGKRTLF